MVIAAAKNLFVVPNFVSVTKPFFFRVMWMEISGPFSLIEALSGSFSGTPVYLRTAFLQNNIRSAWIRRKLWAKFETSDLGIKRSAGAVRKCSGRVRIASHTQCCTLGPFGKGDKTTPASSSLRCWERKLTHVVLPWQPRCGVAREELGLPCSNFFTMIRELLSYERMLARRAGNTLPYVQLYCNYQTLFSPKTAFQFSEETQLGFYCEWLPVPRKT